MAMHEPHPGRQCRSVSFDDGKQCVITTDLDPEVDPLKLKTVVGRPPTPRPSRTDVSVTTPEESRRPMAMHEHHPGRRSRSVSFDGNKLRVIPTELDPEVDPLSLKTVVGRPPTPRPSRGDVTVTPPDEHGESSWPPGACSKTSLPEHKEGPALNPEALIMRLTLECAGESAMERGSDESTQRRERGEGMTEDARATVKLTGADVLASESGLTSEGGGNYSTE
ncbi:uncharacterized protein LOC142774803 [Rhipicephalus microplus]|uniref:uncharacterized protein LOC142774803 n=1 Tax=Rhipicephalus microplus TaxID=6941 RepID=UPI003F6D1CE9